MFTRLVLFIMSLNKLFRNEEGLSHIISMGSVTVLEHLFLEFSPL